VLQYMSTYKDILRKCRCQKICTCMDIYSDRCIDLKRYVHHYISIQCMRIYKDINVDVERYVHIWIHIVIDV
jgi:hypothetical protein